MSGKGNARYLYETTPKWHSFFDDQTGCFFSRRPRLYETSISDKKAEIKPRGAVRYMQGVIIVLVLEIKGTKTASRTTTSASTSTNRMTNKIGVPQPIFSSKKFLFRSDWPFFQARGAARVKLRQNGIDSFSIRLDARGQRRRLYETSWNGER